jgi:hypothetical protein
MNVVMPIDRRERRCDSLHVEASSTANRSGSETKFNVLSAGVKKHIHQFLEKNIAGSEVCDLCRAHSAFAATRVDVWHVQTPPPPAARVRGRGVIFACNAHRAYVIFSCSTAS